MIFFKENKNISYIPEGAILEQMLSNSILVYLKGLAWKHFERLINEDSTKVPTKAIVRMAKFVLKNVFPEFNGEVKRQKSETDIGSSWMKWIIV